MTNSGYDDRVIPLVPAALYGARSFVLDNHGRLIAVYWPLTPPYTQGVNVATCATNRIQRISVRFGVNSDWNEIEYEHEDKAPSMDCRCGYYAYFDQTEETSHLITTGNRIIGIIEASGKCIVGNLGFRAEKAKVVALVDGPPDTRKPLGRVRRKLVNWGEKTDRFTSSNWYPRTVYGALVLAWTLIIFNAVLGPYSFLSALVWVLIGGSMIGSVVSTMSAYSLMKRTEDKIHDLFHPNSESLRLLRANYPDVEFFPTLEAAKEKYPLSKASDLP